MADTKESKADNGPVVSHEKGQAQAGSRSAGAKDDCEGIQQTSVPFRDAFRVWVKVALNSFGGPAGQIAVMHRYLVEEKRWISESRFLHALNYCMLLPGPEAQQLATYIGWMLHKTSGGLVAGTLFVIPGFVSILGLSVLYAGYRDLSVVQWLFFGLKPAALAIVIEAVLCIGKRALKTTLMFSLAGVAFSAIFFLMCHSPSSCCRQALRGMRQAALDPGYFATEPGTAAELNGCDMPVVDAMLNQGTPDHIRPSRGRAIGVVCFWLTAWLGPVFAIWFFMGPRSVYFHEAAFFSKSAVVTFGGAYAVLAYVAQQAVYTYGWLSPGEMLDGLGFAETTPGPLIMVLEFVGFMGAYRNPGAWTPCLPVFWGPP